MQDIGMLSQKLLQAQFKESSQDAKDGKNDITSEGIPEISSEDPGEHTTDFLCEFIEKDTSETKEEKCTTVEAETTNNKRLTNQQMIYFAIGSR